ncbi:MAG: replication protein P [Paraglaciecola polaris]|uniref:replication protein P n=1 Tax=Paraglaciecola polaris TaxID=222814 RepID=UPI0030012306
MGQYSIKLLNSLKAKLKPVFEIHFTEFVNKFEQSGMMDTVLAEYAEQLVDERITGSMLDIGIKRLKKCKFRPKPYDFAQLCKPTLEDMGIPDAKTTHDEIVARWGKYRHSTNKPPFSHRIVEIVSERVGYRAYLLKDYEFLALVGEEHAYWLDRAIRGELPQAAKALEYKRHDKSVIEALTAAGYQPPQDSPIMRRIAELKAIRTEAIENKRVKGAA